VADPGLWIVDTRTGGHRRVATPGLTAPQGILAAAFSPDGTRLAFATSRGMGFGSEIWEVGLDGSGRRQLRHEPNAIVGSLSWAPGGQSLAFNTLFDSPVPFAPAGLWVLDLASRDAQYLTQMDGGHGEEPIWSRDGAALFFVARENTDDRQANHRPEALVSSIRSVDVRSGRETVLVAAGGARQIDLASTPQGDLLFVSNRSGALEIWSLDAKGTAAQITHDGAPKRHPVMVANR
jgi:Tol biopolymer transport system component